MRFQCQVVQTRGFSYVSKEEVLVGELNLEGYSLSLARGGNFSLQLALCGPHLSHRPCHNIKIIIMQCKFSQELFIVGA